MLHLLLDAHQLVAETLLDVGRLHGQHRLQRVLLAPQDLHFLLVVVELIRDVLDLVLPAEGGTSRVCSLPFSEAGFEPKLLPVWSIPLIYYPP